MRGFKVFFVSPLWCTKEVAIYPRDHWPPHVHVEFQDGSRCTVEIETLVVTGTVRPARRLKQPLMWIAANRARLMVKWKEIVR